MSKLTQGGSGKNLLALACQADGLRLVCSTLLADGKVSAAELSAAGPYIAGAAETFAKVRPKYKSFSTWRPSDAESFLQTYRTDRGSFGLLDETTKWAALSICKNIAAEVGDETPLNTLKAALIAAAEGLASADGISPSEQQFLKSLRSELGLVQASEADDEEELGLKEDDDYSEEDEDEDDHLTRVLKRVMRNRETSSTDEWPSDDDSSEGEEEVAEEVEASESEEDLAAITSQFDATGWTLPTKGEVTWAALLELAGVPRETSLLTGEEWKAAIAESRVVSISHSGDGMSYLGKVSHTATGSPGNYCRVAFERSLPPDVAITDVDITEIDADFDEARDAAHTQGEKLLEACRNSDIKAATEAIKRGADLNFTDYDSATSSNPLFAAIEQASLPLVQLLISSGLPANSVDNAWVHAMVNGQPKIAELLKNHGFEADPGFALLVASAQGKCEIISMLAKLTDVNKSHYGAEMSGTPLAIASRYGQSQAVALLIELGAQVNQKDDQGVTPWMAAAGSNQQVIAEQLVKAGANQDRNSALAVACSWGNLNAIKTLSAMGADLNGATNLNNANAPPLLRCVLADHWLDDDNSPIADRIGSRQRREEAFRYLLQAGANIKGTDDDGNSILHIAVSKDCSEVIPFLVSQGAELETRDKSGDTPLIQAINYGNFKTAVMWQLLSCGANPNALDKKGDPAIFAMFREFGSFEAKVAKILLAFGADLSAKNSKGWSLKKRCQKAVENASNEGGSEESAQELLNFLNDDEALENIRNLMLETRETPQSVWRACNFTSQLMEDAELIRPFIDSYIRAHGDAAIELLEVLAHHPEDWRIRYATVAAIGPHFGNGLTPAAVIDLLSFRSFDEDSDVSSAADRILAQDLDLTADLLVKHFAKDPLSTPPAGALLRVLKDHRDFVLENLHASLPKNANTLTGRERISAGCLYSLIAELQSEDSPENAIEDGKQAVELDPSLQRSCWALLAELLKKRGEPEMADALELYNQSNEAGTWEEQRALLEQSIAADPKFFWSYNNIAWHLAAAEDPAERDGAEALKYANKACELEGYHYWSLLDTLAAAYAENGEFAQAVQWLNKAIEWCPGDTTEMKAVLERYKNGQSYPYPTSEEESEESIAEDDEHDEDWDEEDEN